MTRIGFLLSRTAAMPPRPLCAPCPPSRRGVRLLAAACGLALLCCRAEAPAAEPLAVELNNTSVPAACAEVDNVTLTLTSPQVRRFRIAAVHPSYLAGLDQDSFAADWTGCERRPEGHEGQGSPAPAQRTTLYEQVDMWLVALTFPTFWRPATATVRVGDRVARGVHLLQLWMIRPMGGEEVLVLYPADGYWRLRPLAPQGRAPTAFGSSFLIGPVEGSARPVVNIRDILFEPKERTFTLTFERGGSARVRVASIDQQRHSLEVAFDRPIQEHPFAALRSMYVNDANNDVARVAVREGNAAGWRTAGIMDLRHALAREIWAGRTTPSHHNTSSPDMEFGAFAAGD